MLDDLKQKGTVTRLRVTVPGGEPAGIQTPTLLIRSQMLYSVKLQAQYFRSAQNGSANVKNNLKPQNKRFASADKKAIFEPHYRKISQHD